jgi:hypothetical protein
MLFAAYRGQILKVPSLDTADYFKKYPVIVTIFLILAVPN